MSLYTSIKEVSASEVPPHPRHRRRRRVGTRIAGWRQLAAELVLRLERTPKSKWLRVEFESEDMLRRGYTSLYNYFSRYGVSVTTRRVVKNDSAVLYIQRGPDWK